MNNNICLACCFLPLDKGPADWLPRLQSELQRRGLELLYLSSEAPGPLPAFQLQIPILLRDYGVLAGEDIPQAVNDEAARCLAERARVWEGQETMPLDPFLRGYAGARLFFKHLIERVRPACVLTWGSTLPPSILLKRAAEEHGIPVWVWERGLLPDTLMLDQMGHGAGSDLNTSFLARAFATDAAAPGRYEKARDYYLSRRSTKYVQAAPLSREEFARQFNPQGRKVVSFLGHYDHGVGLFPLDHGYAIANMPAYATTADTLQALAGVIRQREDATLIFKPHPLDGTNYQACENDQVRKVTEVSLHDLFEYSDALVFQHSTAQFEAMFYERPIVLLARSAITRWRACYELEPGSTLAQVIDRALRQEDFATLRGKQRAFIDAVLHYYLVRTTDEMPAQHALGDLAEFLSHNALLGSTRQTLASALGAFANDVPALPLKYGVGRGSLPVPAQSAPVVLNSNPTAAKAGCGCSTAKTPCDSGADHAPADFAALHKRHHQEPASVPAASRNAAPASPQKEDKSVLPPLARVLAFNSYATCFSGVQMNSVPADTYANFHACIQRGDADGGIKLLQSSLETDARNAELWDCLGEFAWKFRRLEEARDAFNQTVLINPKRAVSWVKLALAQRELGQMAECSAALQQALQWDHNNSEALRQTAITRMMQKRFAEAAQTLKKLLDRTPEDIPALLLSARCEYEMDDTIAARLKYLQVLKLDPNNTEARESVQALQIPADGKVACQTGRILVACESAKPLVPTPEMLAREYPCPYAFTQLYMVPRTKLDLRFCSYHHPVIFDDQKAVYDRGLTGLDQILHGHPEFVRRRERFLAGDYKGAGCSENCIWFNKWKTTGNGFKLADHLEADGRFKLSKIWLSMGPDCNVTCRYCLEPGEFKMDFNTCDPEVMNVARDFVRRGGELLLTGGETFLPKWGFARILEELVNWGDAKGNISMHTNGTYLNEKNRDLLLRGPMATVGISMDTLRKDLYEYLRRGTSYDLVWNNVTSLVRERNARGLKKPSVILLCAVMKSTADHIVETVDRAVEAGLGISMNALFQAYYSPAFSAREGLHNLTAAELDQLYADVLHIEQKYGPTGPVHYQGFKGQVENQLELVKSGQGEKQVILGGGGQTPRLPHFEQVAQAEAMVKEGRFAEAAALMEPILNLLNRSIRGQRCWASILAGLNRTEEAVKAYRQVMKLDPRDLESKAALEALEQQAVV